MDSHSLKQRIKEMAVFLSRLELCELEIQFLAFENALGKGKDGYSRLSMLYQIWINRLLIRRRSPLSLILEKELVAFRSGTGIRLFRGVLG